MSLKQRLLMLSLPLLLLAAVLVIPVGVSAASVPSTATPAAPTVSNSFTGIPVNGTAAQAGRIVARFTGTMNVTQFVAKNGNLLAKGNVSGTLTNLVTGQKTTITNAPVTAPAAAGTATCKILNLVLGPLHLDLLGLVIDLNQVHLRINANQAPGNLLGNLLCAVANLLNTGGPTSGLAALLNQVLSIVG